MFNRYILLALILLTSSCEHDHTFHGNYVTPHDLSQIKIGKSTQNDVRAILGSPFLITNKNDWIYISKQEYHMPFREHKTYKHTKYRLLFDENCVVSGVETNDIPDLKLKFDPMDTKLKN